MNNPVTTQKIMKMAWNSAVFNTDNASSEAFRKEYLAMCDVIESQQKEGATVCRARLVNEVNEITPCNVDRNQWFFRVVFQKVEAYVGA